MICLIRPAGNNKPAHFIFILQTHPVYYHLYTRCKITLSYHSLVNKKTIQIFNESPESDIKKLGTVKSTLHTLIMQKVILTNAVVACKPDKALLKDYSGWYRTSFLYLKEQYFSKHSLCRRLTWLMRFEVLVWPMVNLTG